MLIWWRCEGKESCCYARSFDNNRRDYFQLIHDSASVKPLACGGNKPHVQRSTEEGVIVTRPRCLRM